MMTQVALMDGYLKVIHDIVPETQRDKFHLILGTQIIGTYTTLEDATRAEREEFKHVACLKYIPLLK